MSLPIDLGKSSAKGSSNLFFGIVISNVILTVGSIVVGRLLGSALYGLYYLSSIPMSLLGLCLGFGIRNGIVRYSSRFNYRSETEKAKAVVTSGLAFIAISGSIFALFSFFLSGYLADFFGRPHVEPLIEVFSLTILTDALVVTSQSVFVGLDKTQHYSFLLIFHALLKTTISLILVSTGFGPMGVVAGKAIASLATCILGISIVYFLVIKGLQGGFSALKLVSNIKMLTSFGFPLYVRTLVTVGVTTHFLNFLMAIYTSDILIGNYKAAMNFHVLFSFFATPISTMLLPTFSKLEFGSDKKALRVIFTSSVKYTSLILVPTAAALIVLSEQLISTFYGQTYALAPLYLSLSALTFIHVAFGQYSIPAVLSSQGETKKSMILGFSRAASVLPLALILIPHFQVVGLIISIIVSGSPTIILGLWWVNKLYDFSIDSNITAKILSCSFLTGMLTFTIVNYMALSNVLRLAVGLMVFSSSFLVFAPLIGAVNLDDISNVRAIFSEAGIMSKLLEIPLRLLSKFCIHDRKRE